MKQILTSKQAYGFYLLLIMSLFVDAKYKYDNRPQEVEVEKVDTFNIQLPLTVYKPTAEESEVYAGRFEEEDNSKYFWNGVPKGRDYLTSSEWRGEHCTSKEMRRDFSEWKEREISNFIKYICKAAVEECRVYNELFPELIAAQAILESNFGKSKLASVGNLFGHKHRGSGDYIVAKDDSDKDRFTKYARGSKWLSIRNHSKILMGKYRSRISGKPTLDKWLEALCGGMTAEQSKAFRERGGQVYATSCMTETCYSQKLKDIIRIYNLTKLCNNYEGNSN